MIRRLVFMVEGQGDQAAIPRLAGKYFDSNHDLHQHLFIDDDAFRIGGIDKFTARKKYVWNQQLDQIVKKKSDLGAIMLVMDGDSEFFEGNPFCPFEAAQILCERAKTCGAGTTFSLAIVFLLQEFESIFITGIDQIYSLSTEIVRPHTPESAPRDAKGWLDRHLPTGYHPVNDQRRLTEMITDWNPIRERLRSYRRFTNAIDLLAKSIETKTPILSPTSV